MKHKQQGFTLVELVVVLLLLGVVAVTAVPKLVSLSSDARSASIENLAASLRSAAKLANLSARIDGIESQSDQTLALAGKQITMNYGYPQAFDLDRGIMALVDAGSVGFYGKNSDNTRYDWVVHLWNESRSGGMHPAIVLSPGDFIGNPADKAPKDSQCFVEYFSATASREAWVEFTSSGC